MGLRRLGLWEILRINFDLISGIVEEIILCILVILLGLLLCHVIWLVM